MLWVGGRERVGMNTTGGELVRFGDGVEGYLFLPDGSGRAPAVAVLHERYGLVQHTVELARKLAEAGFVGCAPNLFSRWQGDREALRRGEVRVTLPDPEVAGILGETI